jgi:hypothetical protein
MFTVDLRESTPVRHGYTVSVLAFHRTAGGPIRGNVFIRRPFLGFCHDDDDPRRSIAVTEKTIAFRDQANIEAVAACYARTVAEWQ